MRRARARGGAAESALLSSLDPAASLARFRELGLDGNPFRELGPRSALAWIEERGPSPGELIASGASCVQILGAAGSGKTSLLAETARRLESLGWRVARRFLAADHDGAWPAIDESVTAFALDEGQRLDRSGRASARAWLEPGGRRLICATHEDLSRSFGRDIATFRLEPASALDVSRLFSARLAAAGGDPSRFELTRDAARRLAVDCAGSLRAVVERLHRVFECLPADRKRVVIDERLLKRTCG